MTERQLQFRVGLFVFMTILLLIGLVMRFGEVRWLFEKNYPVVIHFDEAPGVEPGTPVRKNGVLIGSIQKVYFDEARPGVMVLAEIRQAFTLRKDSHPSLVRSLLGDSTIEFNPGSSPELLKPGSRIEGYSGGDPMKLLARMEQRTTVALESFSATSEEWRKVAKNMNGLMETHRGNLDKVIEEAAESLHQLSEASRNANVFISDPEIQENVRKTITALPKMVDDTRRTISAVRSAVTKMDQNLDNLQKVTAPLAEHSESIVTKLDSSVTNLETLISELGKFSKMLNAEEGSISKFASDPQLYKNLNESAAALQTLLKNLDPVVRDVRTFTDKVARHPEIIGVAGALRGSSGKK
jgi:phospholipid/cholesterol/gamma-HCH transport system substrate-binding protein